MMSTNFPFGELGLGGKSGVSQVTRNIATQSLDGDLAILKPHIDGSPVPDL